MIGRSGWRRGWEREDGVAGSGREDPVGVCVRARRRGQRAPDSTSKAATLHLGRNAGIERGGDPRRDAGWPSSRAGARRATATIRCVGAGRDAPQTGLCARLTRPIGRCNQLGAVAGLFGFSRVASEPFQSRDQALPGLPKRPAGRDTRRVQWKSGAGLRVSVGRCGNRWPGPGGCTRSTCRDNPFAHELDSKTRPRCDAAQQFLSCGVSDPLPPHFCG